MEFLSRLKETNDYSLAKEYMPLDNTLLIRSFFPLQIGDITFSIQASFGHYCTPRKTIADISAYTEMEFAVLRDGDFVSVEELLPGFPLLTELNEHYSVVYAYVPVHMIEAVYQALVANYA